MINRILITGKNSAIPHLRDLRVCSACNGDGWDYFHTRTNPSEPMEKLTCTVCNGEGVIEKKQVA